MFAAKVKSPSEETDNGPDVCGVTLVFVSVTKSPCNVSFVVTFKTILGIFAVVTVIGPSFKPTNGFCTTTVAVAKSQLAGLAPDSHNL